MNMDNKYIQNTHQEIYEIHMEIALTHIDCGPEQLLENTRREPNPPGD